MTLNALIQTSRRPITDLVNSFQRELIFVDNSFQRKLVWTHKQKSRLIETILMDYPMPEIYIWEQPANPETGSQQHSVVDGQQRLTTICQFVANEFILNANHLDENHRTENYAGKYWRDLRDADKQKFWQYVIVVRTIPSSVDEEQVRSIFRRLNETDKSLNPQELRNAEFNGEFISAAEEVSNMEFWRKWRVFSESQIRRMGDMDFASSLLIFLRQGILNETNAVINDAYDLYNDAYEMKREDIATISAFLSFLDRALEHNPDIRDFFAKPNNIYSLFAVYKMNRGNVALDHLKSFVEAYEGGAEHPTLTAYREGVSSRTRSKSNREKRIFGLQDWLENPPTIDPSVAGEVGEPVIALADEDEIDPLS